MANPLAARCLLGSPMEVLARHLANPVAVLYPHPLLAVCTRILVLVEVEIVVAVLVEEVERVAAQTEAAEAQIVVNAVESVAEKQEATELSLLLGRHCQRLCANLCRAHCRRLGRRPHSRARTHADPWNSNDILAARNSTCGHVNSKPRAGT